MFGDRLVFPSVSALATEHGADADVGSVALGKHREPQKGEKASDMEEE